MSDEPAFLRAIADAPTDDTARLVYADWLDDHDEPHKAAFLRAECAWAAVPAPAELLCEGISEELRKALHYPPALRQLTGLAERIPPDWFVTVSRVVWEVRALVARFVALVPQVARHEPEHQERQLNQLDAALTEVREELIRHVGERATVDRFAIPIDYFAFAMCANGLRGSNDLGMTYFDGLSSPGGMAHETTNSFLFWAEEHGPLSDLAACGLWLFVGNRDKHDYHLCCDRASSLFGLLVDVYDSHPWIRPPNGPNVWDVQSCCFLDFLRYQVARAERDQPNG